MPLDEPGKARGLALGPGDRLLVARETRPGLVEPLVGRLDRGAAGVEVLAQPAERALQLQRLEPRRLVRGLERRRLGAQGLLQLGEPPQLLLLARDALAQGAVVVDVDPQLELLELAPQLVVALGLARLALQRAELALDLRGEVGEPDEVLLGGVELAQGRRLALLELGDAGGLLEEHAPVLGVRVDDRADVALADDRVGLGVEPGVEEQLADVAQAAGVVVDEVLALARAVEPPGHADLGELVVGRRQLLPGQLDGQRDLGHAEGVAELAAREDQVLHLLAAQLLGALLAEHPADGVGDVALPAPVGADDGVDPGAEVHLGPVEEGLESLQLELLENHLASLLRTVCDGFRQKP